MCTRVRLSLGVGQVRCGNAGVRERGCVFVNRIRIITLRNSEISTIASHPVVFTYSVYVYNYALRVYDQESHDDINHRLRSSSDLRTGDCGRNVFGGGGGGINRAYPVHTCVRICLITIKLHR
uniref:Uncharacterized protein n=1 Tax=Sipha flava TaxID=143950 RepID=A0A2S2QGI0_9HEMI